STYRPWSSVTTILTNLVGRSVVSAITQTPASGPLALVTMPPRSLSPTVTPTGALCCALTCVDEDKSSAPSATAATLSNRLVPRFMVRSSRQQNVAWAKRSVPTALLCSIASAGTALRAFAQPYTHFTPTDHSLGKRIGPQLELHDLAGRAFAAFDVIGR